jgi:hypothetical protein
MKTKLAMIEEKAAKLQSGWNLQSASSGRKPLLGSENAGSPSKSVDTTRQTSLAPRPPDASADKVAVLQRVVRDKNAEIEDLHVSGWGGCASCGRRRKTAACFVANSFSLTGTIKHPGTSIARRCGVWCCLCCPSETPTRPNGAGRGTIRDGTAHSGQDRSNHVVAGAVLRALSC